MNLQQLKYFVEVAHAGSMSEAAERLRMTQPGLSRHMKQLETDLGRPLLLRHSRGSALTVVGRRLLPEAQKVLQAVNSLRASLAKIDDNLTGQVILGASNVMGRLLFGGVAARIRTGHPGISLKVIQSDAFSLLNGLETGRIDLVIAIEPDRHVGLVYEPLFTEDIYLAGKANDTRLPRGSVNIEDLAMYPLATFSRSQSRGQFIDRAGAAAGIALNIAYEVESMEIIKDLVLRNLAYGLMTKSALHGRAEERQFKLLPIEGLRFTRWMVTAEQNEPTPLRDVVAGHVRDAIASLIKKRTLRVSSSEV